MTLLDIIQNWVVDKPHYVIRSSYIICSKCTVAIASIREDHIWYGHGLIKAVDPEFFDKLELVRNIHPCDELQKFNKPVNVTLAS